MGYTQGMKIFRLMLLIAGILGIFLVAMAILGTRQQWLAFGGHGQGFNFERSHVVWFDWPASATAPWHYYFGAYDTIHRHALGGIDILPRGSVAVSGRRIPALVLPWWFILLCWELPLGLVYLWTLRFRKYELRRQRLAEWRASQKGFPVMVNVPPDSARGQQQDRAGDSR